ncbi:MAG: GNAT family N-acetyltransferase [Ornithinimicrobium sp.]
MIRDRRDEDLVRLCEVMGELGNHLGSPASSERRRWLQEIDAEVSWVFDQAPVSAAPTKNVVGHVQIYRPPDLAWAREVAAQLDGQESRLLVIGRLLVKPSKHQHNIARFLLRECVKYVERQGAVGVLDPDSRPLVPSVIFSKVGFVQMTTREGGQLVRISRG